MRRRDFLKLLGGGVVVVVNLSEAIFAGQNRRYRRDYPKDLNAYLRIGEDGRITCFSGKIEMGQGVITSLAQMLAEELDVSMDRVDMIMGDTALCPWDAGTFGSRSTKYFGPPLRQAAAQSRTILLSLAAKHLKCTKQQLVIEDGTIYHRTNRENKVTYAQLTRGKNITEKLLASVKIKSHSKHKISGKPMKRTDSLVKVTGEAKFAGDIRVPGMLYAKILRPPSHGAKLISVYTSAAEKIEGVKIVRDKDLLAVLHKSPDVANNAKKLIKADFKIAENKVDNNTIFEHLVKVAPKAEVSSQAGDLLSGKKLAKRTLKSRFFNHYVAHATMEPHTALVQIKNSKLTVWASSQTPFRAQTAVAQTLGVPQENVRVITPFVGSGFGGKTNTPQIIEAARLAKLAGRPVQVAWSRQEEFFFDTFRPAAVIDIETGLDKDNKIVFWDYKIYFAGTRSSKPFYNIPHFQVLSTRGWRGGSGTHPFATGAWRGPGSNTNVFAMESHVDMLASKARMDPLNFRLKNLNNERMKNVLTKCAEIFGHKFKTLPSGKGYGLACTDYLGTYVALMAEVNVNRKSGKVTVNRVVCAHDMGEIINPQGARLQIEGCIIMGLSSALTEEVRFRGGRVLTRNFDTYDITRFSWIPEIEITLIDNPKIPPQGCGEPTITCMGGVIANAVYDATGVRLYELPMTPQKVKRALRNKSSKKTS